MPVIFKTVHRIVKGSFEVSIWFSGIFDDSDNAVYRAHSDFQNVEIPIET